VKARVENLQGSTYDNVAVVLSDINKNRNKAEARKLTYVAVSRTSKMNICLTA
jgi:ATP-dependent exoDNAse (exonuclease V) alpha subunit